MVSGLFSTTRELPRLREISSVFVRHGLGDLVRRAGIATRWTSTAIGGSQ